MVFVLSTKMLNISKTFVNKLQICNVKQIFTTSYRPLKEIQVIEEKNTKLIKGVFIPSARSDILLPEVKQDNFCPECTLGLDLKHTDVLILSQYVRSDGCMLPRRVTKLCNRQQRKIGTLVTMAQKSGLMPNLTPANSKKDPKKRYQWKKFNKYYDESTIKC